MELELPEAVRKSRVINLEKRAYRWLERSFWQDVTRHPDDPLDKRISRLKSRFESAAMIPPRQGDSEHFPVSVYIEYDSLLSALKPAFKRYPSVLKKLPRTHSAEFMERTIGRGSRGYSRPAVIEALNEKRAHKWQGEQLKQAKRLIPIELWSKTEEFWFDDKDVVALTPRKAALRTLAKKLDLSEDAVWKLVKTGKKMLPPHVLKRLENAYAAVNDDSTWRFLNEIDPLK
jgi:hypothetical protein